MSGMFLLPLFMQELLGFTATQSGLALMPRTLVMVVAMPIVGRLYNRFPPAVFVTLGIGFAAFGQFMLSGLTLQSTSSHVISSIMLQGVGMSMVLVPLSTLSLSQIPKPQLADAAGLSSLLRQVGGSMGLAVLATLLSRYGVIGRETLKWQLSPDRPEVASRLSGSMAGAMAHGADSASAQFAALAGLAGDVARQGVVLGFQKTFTVGAILFICTLPLVWLLRAPAKKPGAPKEKIHVEIEV
jgi:DHA2 family multidrug resistance protein